MPASTNGDCFPKSAFAIDLEKREVRCPAGQTTSEYRSRGKGRGGLFVFAAAACQGCGLRPRCVKGQGARTVTIQAEEQLQQQARVHNQSAAGRKSLRERVAVEHRIARLVQLGIRQSRYFGRTKTCLQVVMAAVVANVSLVAGYCRRQAQQGTGAAEKCAAELAKSFVAGVLGLCDRYIKGARLVWV